MKIDPSKNTIVCGDNLEWLNWIPDESVDLCYIDPPFFSNRNYEVVWGNGAELRSFGDRFSGGIGHYIEWMRERITLIHKKLKNDASIFVHCDWHASHRLRVLLDGIFGDDNFVNEIIWVRSKNPKGSQHEVKSLSTFTDTIFVYSKSTKYKFYVDRIRTPLSKAELEKKYDRTDSKGRFTDGPIIRSESMGARPNLSYKYKGFDPSPWGWRMEKDKLIELDKRGDLGWSASGKPYRKIRPSEDKGSVISNFWDDIDQINPQSNERLGYPTQKPELLIRRIIELASNENDTVLDCFGGGGTTAKVATDLGRKFITGDVSPVACKVIAERISASNPEARFEIKNLPTTEAEFRQIDGNEFATLFCEIVGWKVNDRKTNDGGIDGYDANNIPVQIKNHKAATGRPDIQKFLGALMAQKTKLGKFVAWEFSRGAMEYIADIKREHGIVIEPVKCGDRLGSLLITPEKQLELQVLYDQKRKTDWSNNVTTLPIQKKKERKKAA